MFTIHHLVKLYHSIAVMHLFINSSVNYTISMDKKNIINGNKRDTEIDQLTVRTDPVHAYMTIPNLDAAYIAAQYQGFYIRYELALHKLTLMKYLSCITALLIIGIAIIGSAKYISEKE